MTDTILIGLTIAPLAGAVWCWATSPTYRQQRAVWRRQHADRRYARTHRIHKAAVPHRKELA